MLFMPFLYFPEDKSEYLPAVITLVIFMSLAVVAVYFMIKKSKKDEAKFDLEYSERLQEIEKEVKEKKS